MKPLIAYGTRPEFIKLKPIIDAFEEIKYPVDIIQIGQHETSFIGSNTNSCIEIESDSGNRINDIQYSILKKLKLSKDKTSIVIVQGDTTTALSVALNSFNSKIPIAHVEAGLRSGDLENPYPEEGNRRMIDHISTLHFCPRGIDKENLLREIPKSKHIFVVGNTVIDTLPSYPIGKNRDTVLITIHRRENRDIFNEWIKCFEFIAERHSHLKYKFITHPSNPEFNSNYLDKSGPMNREELLKFLAEKVHVMITDSGGIQEECSHYNIPVIVCRKVTERPYKGSIICSQPNNYALLDCLVITSRANLNSRGEFGNGRAGREIVSKILEYLDEKTL